MPRKMMIRLFTELVLSATLMLSGCAPQGMASTPDPAEETPGNSTGMESPAASAAAVDPSPPPVTLTVMAAASLTGAFEDLGSQFEADHPGVTLQFNFAGSQQLAQQLEQGALADVFASANPAQMNVVVETGRIARDAPKTFVQNRLVVVFPKDNPAGLAGLGDLANANLKLVFAAPEVPAGQYSLDFLDKAAAEGRYGAGYKEKVLANVVSYEENVKSVLTKVALGEADGGIVYTSDVTGPDAGRVGQIEIPEDLNVIATYPIAAIQDSPHPDEARQFVDFVLSSEGQAVLGRYGFMAAPQ